MCMTMCVEQISRCLIVLCVLCVYDVCVCMCVCCVCCVCMTLAVYDYVCLLYAYWVVWNGRYELLF